MLCLADVVYHIGMVDVKTTEEDVISSNCLEVQMLLPYDVVEDVIPNNSILQYIVLADVIANWQMK